MSYWIERLGFWGYLKQFPINPITIIFTVIIIGFIVLVLNAAIRRSKAERYLSKHVGSAIMVFHKKKIGDYDYADTIRITKLNGEKANWFFIKPAIPALYLKNGENTIEVSAEWARGSKSIKMYQSSPILISLNSQTEASYSLEYYIPENRYIFEPYDNPALFKK